MKPKKLNHKYAFEFLKCTKQSKNEDSIMISIKK